MSSEVIGPVQPAPHTTETERNDLFLRKQRSWGQARHMQDQANALRMQRHRSGGRRPGSRGQTGRRGRPWARQLLSLSVNKAALQRAEVPRYLPNRKRGPKLRAVGSGNQSITPGEQADKNEGCCSSCGARLRSGGAARTSGYLRGWPRSNLCIADSTLGICAGQSAVGMLRVLQDWCRMVQNGLRSQNSP